MSNLVIKGTRVKFRILTLRNKIRIRKVHLQTIVYLQNQDLLMPKLNNPMPTKWIKVNHLKIILGESEYLSNNETLNKIN